MAMSPEERLRELGLDLPRAPALPPNVKANFRFAQRSGSLLYLSGWGPIRDGQVVYRGKLGAELDVEQGYEAAKLTALNHIALLKAELGNLDRLVRWVKVLGMVASAPGFDRQPEVINGYSDLVVRVFGEERGRHARSAVGMAELPFGIPVEVEAIVEVS